MEPSVKDDNVVNMKDFYNQESRITIVEHAIISIDKRFDQIDKKFDQLDRTLIRLENKIDGGFKEIRKESKSDFRWLLTIIAGLAAIMAHGFHWF